MMLEAWQRGVRPVSWVPQIAKEYGKSESHIWRDWGQRTEWIKEIVNLEEAEQLFKELMAELKTLKEDLWTVLATSPNDAARVGAANSIKDVIFRQAELLQSTGLVHKEPLRVEVIKEYQMLYKVLLDEVSQKNPEMLLEIEKRITELDLEDYR